MDLLQYGMEFIFFLILVYGIADVSAQLKVIKKDIED